MRRYHSLSCRALCLAGLWLLSGDLVLLIWWTT